MIARRSFLAGILGAAVAPAVITRPGILMPVRSLVVPEPWWAIAEFPLQLSDETLKTLMDSVLLTSYPGTLRYRAPGHYISGVALAPQQVTANDSLVWRSR